MYTISYGGTALSDFHVYMADCNKHDGPKRDITSSKIPGRSGELTLDNGRYENFDYTIDAYVKENSMSNLDSLKQYLLSESGYRRLEDSMHPGTMTAGHNGLGFLNSLAAECSSATTGLLNRLFWNLIPRIIR